MYNFGVILLFSLPTKWGTELEPWGIALIGFFFLIWVIGCYKYEISVSSWLTKSFLISLRLLIVAILIVILCEPILQLTKGETHKSAIIIMADNSHSMTFEDDYKIEEDGKDIMNFMKSQESNISRMSILEHLLGDSEILPALKNDSEVRIYRFSTKILDNEPEDIEQLTNIYDPLVEVVDKTSTGSSYKRIAGIFLLTDGQQNTGKRTWLQAADYANQKRIPVYPVGIGTTAKKKDVILAGVKSPRAVLVGDKIEFQVQLKHTGYEGHDVTVEIHGYPINGVKEKTVTLGKEGVIQEVKIPYEFGNIKGDKPCEYVLTVKAPPQMQPKEFSVENNQREHTITVYPKKFKVLYFEQLPRWEYRYLKNSLIRDDSILANMWLFSADIDFPQDKSKEAINLDMLPREKKLNEYHCVIIGDVSTNVPTRSDLSQYMDKQLMENLVEFVKEKGGGLIFLAGPFCNPQQYWNTPLADLLPIIADQVETKKVSNTVYHFFLTEVGKRHEIMKLVPDARENEQLWEERLPGFYWYYPVTKAKPGTSVLAIVKADNAPGFEESAYPLIVTRIYGKGKVFFISTDATWRWRALGGDTYFDRFWGQAIRHTSISRLIGMENKYYLSVDNYDSSINDPVEVELEIQDFNNTNLQDYRKIYYQISKNEKQEDAKKQELTLQYNSNSCTYKGILIPKRNGHYKLSFPLDNDKEVTTSFIVKERGLENERRHLNLEELEKLALYTRGKYIKPYELSKFWKDNYAKLTEKKTINSYIEEKPIWDFWGILVILVGLFSVEWIVRKIARMF